MVPILIRSKDRVDYLNTTLKSLTASDIDNSMIVIADDCSETDEMNAYLFSDNIIEIENKGWIDQITNEVTQDAYNYLRLDDYKEELTNFDLWNNYIGNIPYETKIKGIGKRFTTIRPNKNNGDVYGLLWTIMAGFELFKNTDRIIILEDDLIFNKNWFNIANHIYDRESASKVGLVSVYNREFEDSNYLNLYEDRNNIGGVMYLIPRGVYTFLKRQGIYSMKTKIDESLGGDVFLQQFLTRYGYRILNTNDSYIQHIGIRSLCRPGRFIRCSRNFIQPYTWNEEF